LGAWAVLVGYSELHLRGGSNGVVS